MPALTLKQVHSEFLTSNRVRKTITFTGAANAGAVETATMFTVSGHIMIDAFIGFVSTTCGSGGLATLSVGVTGATTNFANAVAVANLVANRWFAGGTMTAAIARDMLGAGVGTLAQITNDNITWTVGTDTLTSGVVVFDLFYTPVTAGATVT